MKRLFVLAICAIFVFSFANTVCAATEITVLINGEKAEFDVPPQIIGNRTMVPMRKTFDLLGAKVEWIAEMRMAVATYSTYIVSMPIGADSFTVTNVLTNETVEHELDVPAQIVNDRTLIPLRAVSAALGKNVSWDGATSTAKIDG
ncbi:MAG: copper amine oxidase N-terminal domain-containing protein [Ruminococcaceae bacterium]|nr:copper amine oxidase N-terminal domain-containing protein [Oscillospiraceae bacterium]